MDLAQMSCASGWSSPIGSKHGRPPSSAPSSSADWLGVTENGQVFGGEEHLDAARGAWLAADVAEALQREDHLVHGRRAELEMAAACRSRPRRGRGPSMKALPLRSR